MNVIVRGMAMPKNCQECDLYIEDACYAKGYREYRSIMDTAKPDDCPLIELPPHATVGNEYPRWRNGALESVIDNAPTVIEAEGSET